MTAEVLIVGAGPAAAGAALALANRPDVRVRVLDVGGRLESDLDAVRQRLAGSDPTNWAPRDVARIATPAVPSRAHRLPEKRTFGSDFPFRDFGQRAGLDESNHVVSGAFGGFSNAWGAQIMVYSAASFSDWPLSRADLEPHYRAILSEIPYTGEVDDLAEYFPLWGPAEGLPPLAGNARHVLERYERYRLAARRHGVIAGRARLAMRASSCVRCGLCMTGCPFGYVYSASQTLEDLVARGAIEYQSGQLAIEVGEADRPYVCVRDLAGGEVRRIDADVVLLGCGAIGTTRLVAASLGQWGRPIELVESAQFVVPFVSSRATHEAAEAGTFTLNQFNLILPFDESGHDIVQVHGYPFNRAEVNALPAPLRGGLLRALGTAALRRFTVGLGYLPSWWSPGFHVKVSPPASPSALPGLAIEPTGVREELAVRRLREVTARLRRAGRSLGVWPIGPMVSLSAPTKSYHVGGSYPHAEDPIEGLQSDIVGRVAPWRHVHLIDASVFPTVSATTFTLTIMANAHRIAHAAVEGV